MQGKGKNRIQGSKKVPNQERGWVERTNVGMVKSGKGKGWGEKRRRRQTKYPNGYEKQTFWRGGGSVGRGGIGTPTAKKVSPTGKVRSRQT